MPFRLIVAVLSAQLLLVSPAAAQDWLAVQTPRFTVVSQLNDRDTRRWVQEFDRFIDALGGLMPINESLLPPLTVVLFRRNGGFSPYRLRTESGVVGGNSGVFINYSSWSLIGMPGARAAANDVATIYHEAVHWYMSADPTRLPLWFAEGIAEVFSTFAVEDGQGRWGRPSLSSVAFLQNTAMQPMAEFLLVTQDEAMHVNATFYSQAWLFVHYLLIGGVQDGGPALLGEFLTNWDSMAPLDAFRATFRMEPEAMDRLLRSYVRQDRLNVASTPLREQAREFEVVPAPAALVELSLARLAFGTGNEAPLSEHLDRLLAIAPDGAEAYDLIAAHAMREERDNIELLLDQAIERGSRDARTYELRAALLADSVRAREPMFAAGAFAAADARRIADHLVSSANLRPLNRRIYTSLADVLFSAQEIRDYDRLVFENGAVVFADAGIMLIGQAALALAAGDVGEARRLLEASLQPPYELSASERDAARALLRQLRP